MIKEVLCVVINTKAGMIQLGVSQCEPGLAAAHKLKATKSYNQGYCTTCSIGNDGACRFGDIQHNVELHFTARLLN